MDLYRGFLKLTLVMFLLVQEVLAFTKCEVSVLTVKVVDACPTDEESWRKAAERFNCSSIPQSCSQSSGDNAQYFKFQYHCVINAWRNATLEVCAPNRTILGFCTEFNLQGALIQDNYDAECTKHNPPCPTSYNSAEAYKYQTCYEMVKENRLRNKQESKKENISGYTSLSSSNRITGHLDVITYLLLFEVVLRHL
ncbi:uncharacterized protein LOC133176220 [Saccostrea echinata]|uniref:uncharacterized protein LOC133176220 n=1 Tax=Saccostrea echinata TaxID=191078 RepID=UPI002A7EED8E|nr:uncharacterized protein LOC133176220 [Saccostrea echinata]